MKKIAFASTLLAVVALPVWAGTGAAAKPGVPQAHPSKSAGTVIPQVDPFRGQSNQYEQLQQEAQIAQIKAKISSNRYQAARYAIQMQKLRAQMGGGMNGSGSSENAKLKKELQGLQQKVAMLMNHQHKQAKDPRPTHATARHGTHHHKVRLLAVLNQGHSKAMAVIDYKGHSQTVTQGQRLGPWYRRGHASRGFEGEGSHDCLFGWRRLEKPMRRRRKRWGPPSSIPIPWSRRPTTTGSWWGPSS